jgi:hypothetical protein
MNESKYDGPHYKEYDRSDGPVDIAVWKRFGQAERFGFTTTDETWFNKDH